VPSRITGSADGANAQQSDGAHPKEPIRSLARREQQSSHTLIGGFETFQQIFSIKYVSIHHIVDVFLAFMKV